MQQLSPSSSLQDRLPLAVVGSNTIIEVNGKRVRGRQYPWGVAEGKGSHAADGSIQWNLLLHTSQNISSNIELFNQHHVLFLKQ